MKKNLNLEQLVKDGFVQLKSLRQLQKQGILPKHYNKKDHYYFNNTKGKYIMLMYPSMFNQLSKVIAIMPEHNKYMESHNVICLVADNDGYFWPIECVQR
jgi:hypothetical protein